MQFKSELIEGRLLRRYKRFFADVELTSGEVVVAHCPNTGSMKTCIEPEARAWLTRARPGRKLAYTWEVAEIGDTRIYVNPVGANALVAEAITDGSIPELAGYTQLRREVRYGDRSRIDILLEGPPDSNRPPCYVEVKNVTLRVGAGCSAFPDAVTERGRKHLAELTRVVSSGARAVMFYCISRTDCDSFTSADDIDPAYGAALRTALESGVEVLAYGVAIETAGIRLRNPVEFRARSGAPIRRS